MKLKKLKPLVLVRWGDAWAATGSYWHKDKDVQPLEMRSVGFLMKKTKTVVALCTDSSKSGDYRHVSSIPMVNVIEIIKLGRKK